MAFVTDFNDYIGSLFLLCVFLQNRYGTLHGGAIGALIEMLACYAIKSVSRIKEGTVTDINISYISGTPIKVRYPVCFHGAPTY